MPDIYMHQKSSEALLKYFNATFHDPHQRRAFILGVQGPDPLYYRLGGRSESAMAMGNALHNDHVGQSLVHMARKIKADRDAQTHAFFAGYLAHYALDAAVHPYVYSHTGLYDPADGSTHRMRGLHMRFERRMDAAWIEKGEAVKPWRYPLFKRAMPYTTVPPAITELIDSALQTVHGIKGGAQQFSKGYVSMRRVIRYGIQDATGVKRTLYRVMDWFNRRRDIFLVDLSFYHAKTTDYDYLNVQRRAWVHPVCATVSTQSVATLYNEGLKNAKRMIETFNRYLNDEITLSDDAFGNRSLNTGKPADDPRVMQHFNLYTEQKD